jgi:C1A family cysteine protease
MKQRRLIFLLLLAVLFVSLTAVHSAAQLPSSYDLRNVEGVNYVTSVKRQTGGTCWTHAAMASMESNLLMTGAWSDNGELSEPDLAEYHLDWWNGFNLYFNQDDNSAHGPSDGVEVHAGGDYLMTAAYTSRGDGAVRNTDGQEYNYPPEKSSPDYHVYYPRAIEWLTAGEDLSSINDVKRAIMDYGAVGTCLYSDDMYIHSFIHYQPPESQMPPNHAVTIVGWDDIKPTQAPRRGAWLVKNSWGEDWGNQGYFWISYYDKHACKNPWMGAVSFQDVEPLDYDHIYSHDYHGWRDTMEDADAAFNAFTATSDQMIRAVSFYVAADSVAFTARVYDTFVDGELSDQLAELSGTIDHRGFHTFDLETPVAISAGDDFYVRLDVSDGGQPYDRTSEVDVLLGARYRATVTSAAGPGESFYWSSGAWVDLTSFDDSANFCIKALADDLWFDLTPLEGMRSTGPEGGPFSPDSLLYTLTYHGAEAISYRVTLDPEVSWLTLGGDTEGTLEADVPIEATIGLGQGAEALGPGVYSTTVLFDTDSPYLGDVRRTVTLAVGGPVVHYAWSLDEDPGWSREGQWGFGQPAGGGGQSGGPDPTSGYTGDNVFGYNLNGDYSDNMSEMNLTTNAIDCSGLSIVTLRFQRWLGVEMPLFDHAYVRVSNDGTSWTTVWENEIEIADTEWRPVEFDISALADDQETVYIRWTIGTSDQTNTYCGWNIDDIEILGYEQGQPPEDETPVAALAIYPIMPNPFTENAKIMFRARTGGPASAFIYDVAGRIVRTLPLRHCDEGDNTLTWDGLNNHGQRVASGVYLVHVEAAGAKATEKMVLIR